MPRLADKGYMDGYREYLDNENEFVFELVDGDYSMHGVPGEQVMTAAYKGQPLAAVKPRFAKYQTFTPYVARYALGKAKLLHVLKD